MFFYILFHISNAVDASFLPRGPSQSKSLKRHTGFSLRYESGFAPSRISFPAGADLYLGSPFCFFITRCYSEE